MHLLLATLLLTMSPVTVDVFTAKADGFASIRIPSIVYVNDTLLAFAEGRAQAADQAKNKLILKRSADGGRTWSAVQTIFDDGERSLNNPCAVVDRGTSRVLLMIQSYPANASERSGTIKPGYDGESIVRSHLLTSDDAGKTWSKPRDVTKFVKRPHVTTVASGPGLGIQIRDGEHSGRILFPFNEGPFGKWNIYAVFSDDGGATWTMGDIAPDCAGLVNEAQFAERAGGSIAWNVRRAGGEPYRKTGISKDGGKTWSAITVDRALYDPGCMASVLRIDASGLQQFLYSGPAGPKREHGTIAWSWNGGREWSRSRELVPGFFGYSVLVAMPPDEGTIGCLYESEANMKISFAKFDFAWVQDSPIAELPALPLAVAGAFAGVSGDALIVAGGANWQNGTKTWHDSVYVLEKPGGKWIAAGKLAGPRAYGVSATYRATAAPFNDKLVCAGGSDTKTHFNDAFVLEWADGKLKRTKLPDLPKTLANACGAIVYDTLYVLGGQESPDSQTALDTVYSLKLDDATATWQSGPALPTGRILASAFAMENTLVISGGASLAGGKRTYLKDGFLLTGGGWKPIADLPRPLVGAAAINGYVFSGDDGAQVDVPTEKHTGFRREVLRYLIKENRWVAKEAWPLPRVTLPVVNWQGRMVLVGGEPRPKERSALVTTFQP